MIEHDNNRAAPPTVDLWTGQFGDSLTGDEEEKLAKAFGTLDHLSTVGIVPVVRGLVFCHRLREGDDPKAAKRHALDLTRRQAIDYFAGLGMPPVESDDDDEGKD